MGRTCVKAGFQESCNGGKKRLVAKGDKAVSIFIGGAVDRLEEKEGKVQDDGRESS
jgi:hypothetical protein